MLTEIGGKPLEQQRKHSRMFGTLELWRKPLHQDS